MPLSTIRHIYREWTCAVSNYMIPFLSITRSDNIKIFKEDAMLTYKRRQQKRALSAVMNVDFILVQLPVVSGRGCTLCSTVGV